MLSLTQNHEDVARMIRVLVVPIGENSLFDSHFEIVARRRELNLFELNRPGEWKLSNSPYRNFKWNIGNFSFEYLRYVFYIQ